MGACLKQVFIVPAILCGLFFASAEAVMTVTTAEMADSDTDTDADTDADTDSDTDTDSGTDADTDNHTDTDTGQISAPITGMMGIAE